MVWRRVASLILGREPVCSGTDRVGSTHWQPGPSRRRHPWTQLAPGSGRTTGYLTQMCLRRPLGAWDPRTHLHVLVLTAQPGQAPAPAVPGLHPGLSASVSPCLHIALPTPTTTRQSCPKKHHPLPATPLANSVCDGLSLASASQASNPVLG